MRSSWWMGTSISIVPVPGDRKDGRGVSLLQDYGTRKSLYAKGRTSGTEYDPPRNRSDVCGKHSFHFCDV